MWRDVFGFGGRNRAVREIEIIQGGSEHEGKDLRLFCERGDRRGV